MFEDIWNITDGCPNPLGATFDEKEQLWNFSIQAKYASSLRLLIYQQNDLHNPILSFDLDPYKNKTNSIWHCAVSNDKISNGMFYGYRVNGPDPNTKNKYQSFDPEKILLDPYAKSVLLPKGSRTAACQPGPNDGLAPLGILLPRDDSFDWQGDPRPRHEHDLIIYETHVRQFTNNANSNVAPEKRGTFSGLIEKIPYLKELGITAVELMPVHLWDPEEGSTWGYMSLNFFTPHLEYTSSRELGGSITEFKTLVRELHKNDIEVILDVVFNHTTEGDDNGPMYSFKGFNKAGYYMLSQTGNDFYFSNYSGCGNTIDACKPEVRNLVLESLRYWVKEMHVDGFRFDIASIFARNDDGSFNFDDPPIISEIAMDPILNDIILIAEPWEPFADLLGEKFPGIRWRQWNALFRDHVKQACKSDEAMIGNLVCRIYGSDDLFPGDSFNAFKAYQSINYLSSHDGYTLYDCLSFSTDPVKSNNNKSWNCGYEGVTEVPDNVINLRKQLIKNNFALLMIANGTPMFRAGEEFLQTQYGNDNPYNVDNETTWMDWSRFDQFPDMFRFFKNMIAFRKRHPSIGRSGFWRDDVQWFGPMGSPDYSQDSRTIAFYLRGTNSSYDLKDKDIYVMINNYWEGIEFTFQIPGPWNRVVNTELPSPNDIIGESDEIMEGRNYLLGPRSIAIFVK